VWRQRDSLDPLHAAQDSKDRRDGREITSLYRLFDDLGHLLYVGITCRLVARVQSHRWQQPWGRDIAIVEWQEFTDDRPSAELEEVRVIRAERPRYNIIHRRQ
jgi:hypothetical protein